MSVSSDSLPGENTTSQQNCLLESWGLPESILKQYKKKGIESMFKWQFECLTSEGVLLGKNLVFSAPTSAGKTMVAELITIQTVLERKKKVLIILPFVSVVREKMLYLQDLFKGTGVRVEGFMGSHAPLRGFKMVQVAVATIEKANSLINRLLEEGSLNEIGCVVVDELHLVGDPHRGYLLELLLTKLKYMRIKNESCKVQVIGMSATLPNLHLLARWLSAALYQTDFRPIPLVEYLKVESEIIRADTLLLERKIKPSVQIKNDPGDVIWLCLETILTGHSILIFCPTKNWCETLATQISAEIMRIGCGSMEISAELRKHISRDAVIEILEQLKCCPAGLDKALEKCVCYGVSFHHAGLTLEERDIIEGGLRNGTLKVLVATSTLSSGVNLPARRVIIRSPCFRSKPIDILAYKQMVGRAGRMGVDTLGESFLICNRTEKNAGIQIVRSSLPPVSSCLGRADISNSLKRAILEVVASGVVRSIEDAQLYASCTLLAASLEADSSSENLTNPISACLKYLENNEFIKLGEESLTPTLLANACLSASLPPDQGLKLLKELHRARQSFVLDTELHIIYQVTPFSVSEQWGQQLDWLHVLSLWENLTPSMHKVGELVGVDERFLVRAVRGTINYNSPSHLEKMIVLRRFYTALALQDLVNEMPLSEVAAKYNASKGMIQSLQQSSSTFAGLVTQFCRRLGWATIELLVSQFCDRLQFGVHRELIDLLRCTSLDASRARSLFNLGIQTLADIAGADVDQIEKALRKAVPFQNASEEQMKEQCKRFWVPGRSGLTEREAAVLVIGEAREILKLELGVKKVEWDSLSETNEITEVVSESVNGRNDFTKNSEFNPADNISNTGISFCSSPISDKTKAGESKEASSESSGVNPILENLKMKETSLNSSQNSCDLIVETSIDLSEEPNETKQSSQSKMHEPFKVLKEQESKEKSPIVTNFSQKPSEINAAVINSICGPEVRRESYDMFECLQVNDSVFNMINTNDFKPNDAHQSSAKEFSDSPSLLESSVVDETKELSSLREENVFPAPSNRNSLDLFENVANPEINSTISALKKYRSIEILNSDSGGDSLLESSLIMFEESFRERNSRTTVSKNKRKRRILNSRSVKQKLDLSLLKSNHTGAALTMDKTSSPDLFDESFSTFLKASNLSLQSNNEDDKSKSSQENSLFSESLNLDTQICGELDGKISTAKPSKRKSYEKNKTGRESQSKIPVSQKFRRLTRSSQISNSKTVKLSQSKSNKKSIEHEKLMDNIFLADSQEFSLIKNYTRRSQRTLGRNSSFQKSILSNPTSNILKKSGPKTRSSTRKSRSSDVDNDIIGSSQEVASGTSTLSPRCNFKKKTDPSRKHPLKK